MTILNSIILGALQGITEFLPISSSGHLVLAESVLGLRVEALKSFDVAVHLGTLVSILVYFWGDVCEMIKAFFRIVFLRMKKDSHEKLVGFIVIGTIPAVIAGLFLGDEIDEIFRGVEMVGVSMMCTAILFLIAEYVNKKSAKSGVNFIKSLVIGIFQAVALIPGVSRSGSTISAGLIGKMERADAAKFSFLLGIPAIAGAGVLTFMDSSIDTVGLAASSSVAVGFLVSAIVGFFSIYFLMKFLKKYSLKIFSLYLLIVGSIVYFI
jgi:undecaprenyl-diphosphatase